jgi:hypothetical protein
MNKVKLLEVDEKMEQSLTTVCDAALKYQGLQVMGAVNDIAAALRDCKEKEPD